MSSIATTNLQKIRKKQDNLRYILYTKIWTLCFTPFFVEFLNLAEGDGLFNMQKIMHFALHLYIQKINNLVLSFLYKKPDTLRYIFICKKQCTLCYVFMFKIYRIVLISNYEHTYDQNDQIEK